MKSLILLFVLCSAFAQAQVKFTAAAVEYRKAKDSLWSVSTEFQKGSGVTIDYPGSRITIRDGEVYDFRMVSINADTTHKKDDIYVLKYTLEDKEGISLKATMLMVPPSWFLLTFSYPEFQYRFYLIPK